ncbi:MAG: HAD family hydrolase [Verrucomicrobiota bacterium]
MANHSPSLILSLDFDGTTVDPIGNPPVHGFLIDTLRRLRNAGAVWVVNTGRTLEFTEEGLLWCQIPFPPDYLIVEETCLLESQGEDWVDVNDWNMRRAFACREMVYHAPEFFQSVQEFVETKTAATFIEKVHAPHEIIATTEAEMDSICEVIERHREAHPDTDIHYERNTIYLRFAHRDFNKGTSLAELGRHLGIGPEHIFAAGDNYNDLPKLDREIAAHLACPANSIPAVKEAIRSNEGYVASSEYGKGVAEALNHFFPIG